MIEVFASEPVREEKSLRASGYQVDSKTRKAVEDCAMARAKQELILRGYIDIEDTSSSEPFDFTCKKAGVTHYVEVKGTQGDGESVILTAGEVKHARKFHDTSIMVIVSRIQVDSSGVAAIAPESRVTFIHPWTPKKIDLKVLQYQWDVPVD